MQEHKTNAVSTGVTNREPVKTITEMIIAIGDSLSNLASSDDEEDGNDEEDDDTKLLEAERR